MAKELTEYDKQGRLQALTFEDFDGNLIARRRLNYYCHGDHTTNLIASAEHETGSGIEKYSYTYDANANIKDIKVNGKLSAHYTYDSLNRLKREDNAKLNSTVVYEYNTNSNILFKTKYNYSLNPLESLTDGQELCKNICARIKRLPPIVKIESISDKTIDCPIAAFLINLLLRYAIHIPHLLSIPLYTLTNNKSKYFNIFS